MSLAFTKPSGLSAAFAAAPVDIPKVQGEGFGGKHAFHDQRMLPTPPNSISPNLPPQPFHPDHGRHGTPFSSDGCAVTPPIHLDSDTEVPGGQPLSSAALEALGNNLITPAYLAQHHLPELLLNQGPLAIRYILSHLTQTVPGFSRIATPKARRIVVAALEGKFKENTNVTFDKVGWGRWDARMKGQPRKRRDSEAGTGLDSLQEEGEGWESRGALQIPSFNRSNGRLRGGDQDFSHSYDSVMSGMDNSYDEADAMSLDGDEDEKSTFSESDTEDNMSETTEEQDWAASDAAGRWEWDVPFSVSPFNERNASLARSSNADCTSRVSKSPNLLPQRPTFRRTRIASEQLPRRRASGITTMMNSVPTNTLALPANFDTQEQEAVAALLAMGGSVP